MWTFTSLILILAHLQYLCQDQSTQYLSYEMVTILNSCLTWPRDTSDNMVDPCQWKVEVFVDDSPLETASKLPLDGVRRHCIQTRAYLRIYRLPESGVSTTTSSKSSWWMW